MEYKKGLIFILIIAEIILTLFSIYESSTGYQLCLTGKDCEIVQNSPYSNILGMKLTTLGIIAFPALLIIYYLSYKKKITKIIFPLICLLGAIFSLYFLYIQFFVLHRTCSTCFTIDSLMIIIFITAILDFYNK